LFPATKEQPKEMLPIFSQISSGDISIKPIVQVVFEQLYDGGLREFCFVVGRGKRNIEDHFTADGNYFKTLNNYGRKAEVIDLEAFHEKLRRSTIAWLNQVEPKGFGDAVLTAHPFVKSEPCIVHAGDSCVVSKKGAHIERLLSMYERLSADAAFIVMESKNPRDYGIVEGTEVEAGVFKVNSVVEKPDRPKTNMAVVAIYAFGPMIFEALKTTQAGKNGEIQLTDAIQKLVDLGSRVYAMKLDSNYVHLDIGSPQSYWNALSISHEYFSQNQTI
jgi:UTP--glucose-1-phosphate uridylyltransferase